MEQNWHLVTIQTIQDWTCTYMMHSCNPEDANFLHMTLENLTHDEAWIAQAECLNDFYVLGFEDALNFRKVMGIVRWKGIRLSPLHPQPSLATLQFEDFWAQRLRAEHSLPYCVCSATLLSIYCSILTVQVYVILQGFRFSVWCAGFGAPWGWSGHHFFANRPCFARESGSEVVSG